MIVLGPDIPGELCDEMSDEDEGGSYVLDEGLVNSLEEVDSASDQDWVVLV